MVRKIKIFSILLIKFVYLSLTNKQNLNFLKSSSYKKVFYSRSKIMKMLLTSFWSSSIYCFYIRLDALFPMRIISNEIQQQAQKLPTLAQSLQCRYTLPVTAVNWLLPDDPLFPQLRSDILHGSQQCWLCALCSMWALSCIKETVPQVAYAASLAFFVIFETLTGWGVGAPQQVRVSKMPKKTI